MSEHLWDAIAEVSGLTGDHTVTIETRGGSRYAGQGFAAAEKDGQPAFVSIDVENGTTVVPWHAVDLIHVHEDM